MLKPKSIIEIDKRVIGEDYPVYFIADIAANHDGDFERARDLIYMAAEAGAHAAKFQHFKASSIVSDKGFKDLGNTRSHQGKWKKSVFQTYKDAEVSNEWTERLKDTCNEAGISFFTSPYDFEIVDRIDPYVPAYKIGSGDITWTSIIEKIASKGKPYIIAAGASSMDDVYRAIVAGLKTNNNIALLQCNTNYTGSIDNMKYIQLNVLKSFRAMFPSIVLGLSDHTPGHATVLGAVALGARIIEKHFTDDIHRDGPDHGFSMDPKSWREMCERTYELQQALGDGVKKVEQNEIDTVMLQRRAVRANHNLTIGHKITADDLVYLRPCPKDGIPPYLSPKIIGNVLNKAVVEGSHIKFSDLDGVV